MDSPRNSADEEQLDLLPESNHDPEVVHAEDAAANYKSKNGVKSMLYVSHFLSAFNSRAFEFGAFLFLATIFPQTLLPASVYALARAGSAAAFSPLVGTFVDRTERLRVLRASIIGQRVSVAASSLLLWAMIYFVDVFATHTWMHGAMLATLSVLACVEKLSAVMNTIAVERDWVVAIAGDRDDTLRTLNSQMRRIDLFCKLVAPLLVSLVDTWSSIAAIIAVGSMTCLSLPIEYFTIAKVFNLVPALRKNSTELDRSQIRRGPIESLKSILSGTRTYFSHPAFLPSFALALLYLTVLSFSGQMITYLIALGFSSSVIGVLRGTSAMFELSATWIAPKVMSQLGPVRAGIWFINYQILCVAIATLCFWLPSISPTARSLTLVWATGAIASVILSRTGLWGFDLSVQIIVQEEVEPDLRGTFSSQEFAFQNIFEMLSFASTIVFARPEQFKIPAAISAGAVGMAAVLYAVFVRGRRGHLVHWSRCIDRKDGRKWIPLSNDAADESA